MRKILTRVVIAIAGLWAATRFFLDLWGYMQAIQEAFENRGAVMKVLGLLVASQWLPVSLFIIGVLALFYLEFGRKWLARRKNIASFQPMFQQKFGMKHSAYGKKPTELKKRWVASIRNENQAPPSNDTFDWITRFELFAVTISPSNKSKLFSTLFSSLFPG